MHIDANDAKIEIIALRDVNDTSAPVLWTNECKSFDGNTATARKLKSLFYSSDMANIAEGHGFIVQTRANLTGANLWNLLYIIIILHNLNWRVLQEFPDSSHIWFQLQLLQLFQLWTPTVLW